MKQKKNADEHNKTNWSGWTIVDMERHNYCHIKTLITNSRHLLLQFSHVKCRNLDCVRERMWLCARLRKCTWCRRGCFSGFCSSFSLQVNNRWYIMSFCQRQHCHVRPFFFGGGGLKLKTSTVVKTKHESPDSVSPRLVTSNKTLW